MPHLRLCRAQRWKEYTGYGLTIMVGSISPPKAGHYINAVEPNSPAEAAGLKAGDRILAINNQKVADPMTHSEVMAKAKTDPNQVCGGCCMLYGIITQLIIFGWWFTTFKGDIVRLWSSYLSISWPSNILWSYILSNLRGTE